MRVAGEGAVGSDKRQAVPPQLSWSLGIRIKGPACDVKVFHDLT